MRMGSRGKHAASPRGEDGGSPIRWLVLRGLVGGGSLAGAAGNVALLYGNPQLVGLMSLCLLVVIASAHPWLVGLETWKKRVEAEGWNRLRASLRPEDEIGRSILTIGVVLSSAALALTAVYSACVFLAQAGWLAGIVALLASASASSPLQVAVQRL